MKLTPIGQVYLRPTPHSPEGGTMNSTLKAVPLPGDWYRNIAASYRSYAESCVGDHAVVIQRRLANFNEAAKYEAIASRLDRTA